MENYFSILMKLFFCLTFHDFIILVLFCSCGSFVFNTGNFKSNFHPWAESFFLFILCSFVDPNGGGGESYSFKQFFWETRYYVNNYNNNNVNKKSFIYKYNTSCHTRRCPKLFDIFTSFYIIVAIFSFFFCSVFRFDFHFSLLLLFSKYIKFF